MQRDAAGAKGWASHRAGCADRKRKVSKIKTQACANERDAQSKAWPKVPASGSPPEPPPGAQRVGVRAAGSGLSCTGQGGTTISQVPIMMRAAGPSGLLALPSVLPRRSVSPRAPTSTSGDIGKGWIFGVGNGAR